MKKTLKIVVTAFVAIFGSAFGASAQSALLAQCQQVAQSFFGDYEARADMQYNGQRTDGTYAVNGRIFLEARFADFACSFSPNQRRMIEFFADGRTQNSAITGGVSGAGEFFTVSGIASNDVLNVRRGPSTRFDVIGALVNGDRVRNLGCRQEGTSRWCRVGLLDDMGGAGWVNARYLSEGSATQLPAAAPQAPNTGQTTSETVRFPSGSSGTELRGSLLPGASKRYILNARNGQFLYVRVANDALEYQISNPNKTPLLDMISAAREYRGQLWQSGDHVIEVINRGSRNQSYNIIIGID